MNPFLVQLSQASTWMPLSFVMGLGLAACYSAWRDRGVLLAQIQENDRDLSAALRQAEAKGPRVVGAPRLLFRLLPLLDDGPESSGPTGGPRLVRGNFAEAYAEACAGALGSGSTASRMLNAAGHALTGIALIFTFAFIAYVLASEVPAAIKAVSTPSKAGNGNQSLETAVALIGAKFMVSAAGLLLSLVFRWVEGAMRQQVFDAALHSGHHHRGHFISRDAWRFGIVASRLDGLNQQLSGLGSLEVSVKALGNEVTAHIGSLMKAQVADQICGALDDLRVFAEKLTSDLSTKLSESSAAENKALKESIDGVRSTIAEQSKSDVGKLVEQMRDMMSGGFQSESQNMVQSMAALRDVLPKLEEQMRHMTEVAGNDMRSRGEANAKMQSELMAQLQATISSAQLGQAASQAALTRLIAVTEQSAGTLQSKISASGKQALDQLLEVSSKGLGKVGEQLSSLNSLASGNVAAFAQEVGQAKKTMEDARSALTASLESLRALSTELRASLGGTNTALERSSTAFQRFDSASSSVGGASTQIGQAVTALAGWVGREEQLLVQQRRLAEEVLPRLMTQYVKMLDDQSKRIEASWADLAEKVGRTVKGAGADLAENVEALVEQVGVLRIALGSTTQARR